MTGVVGHALILVGLAIAAAGAAAGLHAGWTGSRRTRRAARGLAHAFLAVMAAATGVMEWALLTDDFSVSYVAEVGSRSTPTHITIVSLWSSLDGSILLWGLVLAVFVAVWARVGDDEEGPAFPWSLATMFGVGIFFSILLAWPANPFAPTPPPVPEDGTGPNPLLQNHVLMIIHPPMLYLGYVGMTVPFGIAVGSLLEGRLDVARVRRIRRWTLIPWGFLTAGIVLGGWWAYEVLGWGGYWAWDPVENASFIPWLSATTFLHAAMLRERRGMLNGWCMVLVLATFHLTILGTFMTRSGVFNSVHSFTESAIGPTFLAFLGVGLVGSVLLLALRLPQVESRGRLPAVASRETTFLLNNLLLATFTFTVLVGTLFPLLNEAIRGNEISVGAPFFDRFAAPLGVALLVLMGVGPALPWGRADGPAIRSALAAPGLAALLVGAAAWIAGARDAWPLATVVAAGFAMTVSLRAIVDPIRARLRRGGEGPRRAVAAAFVRARRSWGGHVVHVGIAVAAVAIALSSSYQREVRTTLDKGESVALGGYDLRFRDLSLERDPHRWRSVAQVAVRRGGERVRTLEPAMNYYESMREPLGSPDVWRRPHHDLYLSAVRVDPHEGTLSLRAYVNPAVSWLWIALGIILTGCAMAAWPSESRRTAAVAGDAEALREPPSEEAPETPEEPDPPEGVRVAREGSA